MNNVQPAKEKLNVHFPHFFYCIGYIIKNSHLIIYLINLCISINYTYNTFEKRQALSYYWY